MTILSIAVLKLACIAAQLIGRALAVETDRLSNIYFQACVYPASAGERGNQ
jgi:hypothetical protein